MIRPVLACCLFVTGACSMHLRAGSSAGSASGASGAAEPARPARSPRSHGKVVSASFHKSGSIRGKLDWQGRSGQLCRAAAPFKFVGMAKLAGTAQVTPSGASATGHAEASGNRKIGRLEGRAKTRFLGSTKPSDLPIFRRKNRDPRRAVP
jgi:hypothetical protein